jgi:hypothetical protein
VARSISLLVIVATSLWAQVTSVVEGRVTDPQGLTVAGAEIKIEDRTLGISRKALSGADGGYKIQGLPPGGYTVTISKTDFATDTTPDLELTVNDTVTLNLVLKVGSQKETIVVSAGPSLLESVTSSTNATVLPDQISQMPINGRNYLDLLQLVPGVAINRQQDPSLDGASPIMGERGGNTEFLIDGLPNEDAVNGGAAAQFNQDSILEFQVLLGGYEAEFGHASGGVINVISKSGTNSWHGGASLFHRNYNLDSSDSPLVLAGEVPFLLRYDADAQIGGPIVKDKIYFFGSAERVLEDRQLNFSFPAGTPPTLVQLETPFNLHSMTYDTRARSKLEEQMGHHRLSEQFNLTNTHVTDYLPLTSAIDLPSTRNNFDSSRTMVGLSDQATLGNQENPLLLTVYAQYRADPSSEEPSHPQAGTALSLANLFSSLDTGRLSGDQGQIKFGPGHTALTLKGKYASSGANLAKQLGAHGIKFGWDFQWTSVDGVEANNLVNQLFVTSADLGTFGPVNAGLYDLTLQGGATPLDNVIRLRNSYNGAFIQDDWKVLRQLTFNLGLRWDHDSRFPNNANLSPRLGVAWNVTSKTVLRGSWGLYYDHFRLGLARDIPGFGGADLTTQTFLSFPRLFYGNPSTLTALFATIGLPVPCASPDLSDAQIASMGATCSAKFPNGTHKPLYGFDHLNGVVTPGHAPIPANVVVNSSNVQGLTGFTPQQFADAASQAVGASPGLFSYDPFGNLTIGNGAFASNGIPITVDPSFKMPYTNGFSVGVQRELSSSTMIQANYFHKSIDDILGIRDTNLAFEARIPGHTKETTPAGSPIVFGFGPWFHGAYDAIAVQFAKRMSRRFSLNVSYTWTHEIDNDLNSNLVSDLQTGLGAGFAASKGPTDSFIGMTTLVADPATGQTNANASFTASNGNPVPKAGIFYNGPDLDKGPSDMSLNHTALVNGFVELPWNLGISGIFMAQSGFRYSASFAANPPDVDGDNSFNGVDFYSGRNHFVAPPLVNTDVRLSKRFNFGEQVKVHAYLEFFNLFDRANPAAVNGIPPAAGNSTAPRFGEVLQVLPGREGQIGLQIEF